MQPQRLSYGIAGTAAMGRTAFAITVARRARLQTAAVGTALPEGSGFSNRARLHAIGTSFDRDSRCLIPIT